MTVRLRERSVGWLLVGSLCVLAAWPAQAFDDAAADRALQFARTQLNKTATNPAVPTNQYPKASTDGTWKLVRNDDMVGWTQGFFPGLLWLMYDQGRDATWKSRGDAWTRNLELQKTNTQTHDLGFKFMPSFGQAYRLTGDAYYQGVLLTAARSLATRYNSTVGVIKCCDWNPAWQVPTVVDTMMNLELLFWASRNGGDPAWNDMALNHALKTMTDMVRSDGSTFQVVDYDTAGHIRSRGTYQGYSNSSTWARGQAWAIYGFTMAYRYTRDARMLQTAQKVTNYYLDHLPADSIPFWDFNAPAGQQVKDSSAAAAVASALQELSTYVTDPAVAQRYRNAALAMLDSLSSSAYLASGSSSPGILLHGVGFYMTPVNPPGSDIDKSLIYGDYYFVEALIRYKLARAGGWYSTLVFPGSLHDLGANNTGVQVAEFDVTPLSKPVDAVIGYAGRATNVTAYSSLSLLIRLNPSGFFDVRRGGDYAALASLPYEINATYHVRMRADLGAKRYSVWVRPPGGNEVLLADNFGFRSDAPAITDLGKVSLKSGHFDNELRVSGHSVRLGSAPVTSPSPSEPSPPAAGEPPPTGAPEVSDPPAETPPERESKGCAAAPGSMMALVGLLLWLLGRGRRSSSRA
ncbi:MAG: glycoside hydrolase family 88 protein [Hyalangium sp.]|uniref:glycoside hydrolase family 88 protein n=1 Tax=Hyalangium sp. TaxID=2028555 RepID=UPI00389AD5CD